MICKNNANNNFSPTPKSNWLLGPDHDENFIDMICGKNVDNNYFPILKSTWPEIESKLQLKHGQASFM